MMKRLTGIMTLVMTLVWCGIARAQVPAAPAVDPKVQASYDSLVVKVQQGGAALEEAEVLQMLQTAEKIGQPYAAHMAVRSYLARSRTPSPALVLAAARNARMAGDYRTAVGRYKAYLETGPAAEQGSAALAELYTTVLGFVDDADDAYQISSDYGHKYRGSTGARQYDRWYLGVARSRQDYVGMALRLAAMMQEKMPLPQEQWLAWDHLDWLMNQLSRATAEQHATLLPARTIVSLIREDKTRQLRYGLVVANLEYHAGAAGKNEKNLAAAFDKVIAAADAYISSVATAEALRDVMQLFAGGFGQLQGDVWNQHLQTKRDFFVSAFKKLGSDAERTGFLAMYPGGFHPSWVGSAEQWAELGIAFPKVFNASPTTIALPMHSAAHDRAAYQKQTAYLQGVPSGWAAAINTLAHAAEFEDAADYLMKNESWHLGFETFKIWREYVWPTWTRIPANKDKATQATYDKALIKFAVDHITTSPMAIFDREAAKQYLLAAWRASGSDANDKSQVPSHLARLAWVPWTEDQRQEVIAPAYDEFKKWTAALRKAREAKPDSVTDAQLHELSTLEIAFKKAMDATETDIGTAPSPLAKLVAQAVVAERDGQLEAFTKAGRELYALVKDYDAGRFPLGQGLLGFLVSNRKQDGFDTLDFQLEILTDQIATHQPGTSERLPQQVFDAIFAGRSGWGLHRIPKGDADAARKVNDALAKALHTAIDQGRYWHTAFEWFRGTRKGTGWHDQDRNVDVLAKMIEKKTLVSSDPKAPFAASTYMWLIRGEFQGLASKYNVDRDFDDLFVAEAKAKSRLDWAYWRYGRDEQKKIVNAAAEVLATFDHPPIGIGIGEFAETAPFDRGTWLNWVSRVNGADAASRDKFLSKVTSLYGKTYFDLYAAGGGYFWTVAEDIRSNEARATYFANLKAYLTRAASQPDLLGPPYLRGLAYLPSESITDEELAVLLQVFPLVTPLEWSRGWYAETLASLVHENLVRRGRYAELFDLAPHFWRIARDTRNVDFQRKLASYARTLLDEAKMPDLAAAYGSGGMEIVASAMPEDTVTFLRSLRSQALVNVGTAIPVPPSDPRYVLYAAQADYLAGRLDSAWDKYLERRDLVATMYKDLDVGFSIWLVEKNTQAKQFQEAEAQARQLITWVDSQAAAFEPELRAHLELAYADIAFAQQEFPRARAGYQRIAANKDYDGTNSKALAELKMAVVDGSTGQIDAAMAQLQSLSRRPEKFLQTEAHYYWADLLFQQESYDEATSHLEQVFIREANHQMARILQGKVDLARRRYETASVLQIGLAEGEKVLVPGKPMHVNLQDKTLAITGDATSIEIRVWTDNGDEETFSLFPFGDDKTRFRGEIATVLGAARKGDHILQVVGGEKVNYGFSDKVKSKDAGGSASEMGPQALTVVTDAKLYASSGRILTETELEELALEAMIRRQLQVEADALARMTLSNTRPAEQIKPGNPIHVRVVDADRSTTDEKDKVTVQVRAESGDELQFELVETETHSGVFEGAIPTASGQAIAFASDSQEGSEPNFAISSKDYPAWVGRPDNLRPKVLSVDLNDNVPLGVMTISANVPGRKIKEFTVQTSVNGRDYTTVGGYPEAPKPWDGSLQMDITSVRGRVPSALTDVRQYLERGYVSQNRPKLTVPIKGLTHQFDGNVMDLAGKLKMGHHDWFIARMYGAFYVDRNATRTFRLDDNDRTKNVRYIIAVDGKVMPRSPQEWRGMLSKGVHRLEVFIVSYRQARANFQVLCDSDQPPYMVPCPADMFDPAKHPVIKEVVYTDPAVIKPADNGGTFGIEFAVNTRARVVRLLINDFETDAPAISRIALTDSNGRAILPTAADFMDLRRNGTLEMVPGDSVRITYEDPSVISDSEKSHTTSLTATFTDAELSACFVEYTLDTRTGEREPRYFPMRRFAVGDRINVFINDPDRDISPDKDKVQFTANTYDGKEITLEALETDGHSGVFLGVLFPVRNEPNRNSEIKVGDGENIYLKYLDNENTDPGVPWTRSYEVEQTWGQQPEIRVLETSSVELEGSALESARRAERKSGRQFLESVPVSRSMVAMRPAEPLPAASSAAVLVDGPIIVELTYPAIARSPLSDAELYVQTSTARELAGKQPSDPFDPNVPGTIKLIVGPSDAGVIEPPPGYSDVVIRGTPYAAEPLDEGRFTFVIPFELAPVPERSFAFLDREAYRRMTPEERPKLAVAGDDTIYVGFLNQTPDGEEWVTRSITLKSDVFVHMMDRRYQEPITSAYVGENVYYRVIHRTLDTTPEKDVVTMAIQTASGQQRDIQLMETFGHSGIFKGVIQLMYNGETEGLDQPGVLPVAYGDTVAAGYVPNPGADPIKLELTIFKGADGAVLPFTKRFQDPEIAVQTQFTVAEAYFELAKRHRDLEQDSLARRSIAQGKKLLEEAIRDYPDTEARAQAEYLLANLSFEFAADAANPDIERQHYLEAIKRFSDIVSTYPDSPYAPKSQYKKALVLEKMGEIDQACEEYVKLSYRYPDNELVAETIARLGQYFLTKGKEFDDQADAQTDPVEREKVKIKGRDMFKTAAQVFGRLSVRFPDHALAGKTLVLSAQCYMRAEDYKKAVEVFRQVYETSDPDKELASESMYWAGDCYMKAMDYLSAFRVFKKLTWDYPESKWAKFARGRLTEESLIRVADQDAEGF